MKGDDETEDGLADLARRVDAARLRAGRGRPDGGGAEGEAAEDDGARRSSALGQGFRLASELVAALLVGLGLGLALDRFADTGPWGLLGGLAVGFSAGMNNAIRAFGRGGQEEGAADGATGVPAAKSDDGAARGDAAKRAKEEDG